MVGGWKGWRGDDSDVGCWLNAGSALEGRQLGLIEDTVPDPTSYKILILFTFIFHRMMTTDVEVGKVVQRGNQGGEEGMKERIREREREEELKL